MRSPHGNLEFHNFGWITIHENKQSAFDTAAPYSQIASKAAIKILFDPHQLFLHGLNIKQVFSLQRIKQKPHMSLTFHAQ